MKLKPLQIRIPILLLALLPFHAHAFHLDDHKRIMIQAMNEMQACLPGKLTAASQRIIWQSDLQEDINILLKDTFYSHFYNPNKKLAMLRFDSSVRVKDEQSGLMKMVNTVDDLNQQSNSSGLGAAAHHIQDMAVPAHVVPVMHGLGDGFETYPFEGDISSGWSCAEIAKFSGSQDLLAILKETALLTLAKVQGTQYNGLSGEGFWKGSSDNQFGDYGVAGNNFGQAKILINGRTLTIDPQFYSSFKQAQMRLAVQQSIKALYWYLGLVHSN